LLKGFLNFKNQMIFITEVRILLTFQGLTMVKWVETEMILKLRVNRCMIDRKTALWGFFRFEVKAGGFEVIRGRTS